MSAPPISNDERYNMIRNFAPEVRLHPDECNFPCSTDWYIQATDLHVGSKTYNDATAANIVSLSNGSTSAYIKIHSDSIKNGMPLNNGKVSDQVPCYVNMVPNSTNDLVAIQYFFFFSYNGLPKIPDVYWDHEGDWEYINVYLSRTVTNNTPTYNVLYIEFGGHGGSRIKDKSEIKFNDTHHPIVYTANQTHASYEKTGHFGYLDYTANGGPIWFTWFNIIDIGIITDTNHWSYYKGKWGSTKSSFYQSSGSPKGPRYQRFYINSYPFYVMYKNNQLAVKYNETNKTPHATMFMQQLHLLYKKNDSNDFCWSTFNFETKNWIRSKIMTKETGDSIESEIHPLTSDEIACCSVLNKIVAVYKAASSNQLYIAYYMNRNNRWIWSGDKKIENEFSDHSPSIAFYNGLIYMIYKGQSSTDLYCTVFDQNLNRLSCSKIEEMSGKMTSKSDKPPSLCVWNNKLFMAHKGSGSNNMYVAFFDGVSWYGEFKLVKDNVMSGPGFHFNSLNDVLSTDDPSICVFGTVLYMCYKGQSSNDLYLIQCSVTGEDDGTFNYRWWNNNKIKDGEDADYIQSSRAPCIISYNDHLFAFYKASSSDNLYYAVFPNL